MAKSKKALLGCSYVGFFVFSFLLFVYWTFPYDRVAAYVEQQIEYPGGQASGYEVEIGELSPSWFTGVEIVNLRLSKVAENPDDPPAEITLDRVVARVSLLSLIGGDQALSFEGETAGGTFEGEFEATETSDHIALELDSLNLRQMSILREFTQLGFGGVLGGSVDLTIADEAEATLGEVDLRVAGLQVGPGKIRFDHPLGREGLDIDVARAGDMRIKMVVENGNGELQTLEAPGDDLQLEGSGSIRLRRPMGMSQLAVNLQVGFSEEYRNSSPRTQGLFMAADNIPLMSRAKQSDGVFAFQITGQVSRPSARPARGGGR